MSETRYPALRRYITETPWALQPSTLMLLREVVGRRLDGEKLSADEIAEITAAAPKRAKAQPAQGSIAVLPLWGVLAPHQVSDLSSGPTTALDSWGALFDELVNDPSVATIVLDVDSPGGSVDLVPETAAKVRAGAAKKQVVAVANTRIGSAAYWIASQAGELYVSPSGAVGSVGVYAMHEDISAQLEQEGVAVTFVSAGDHKIDGNPFQPLSDEARATIQANVDAYYRAFVADVGKGRGADTGFVEANFGQGKMLLAGDAVKAGMADGVQSLEQTLAKLVGTTPTKTRARASELELVPTAGVLALNGTTSALALEAAHELTEALADAFADKGDLVATVVGEVQSPDPEAAAAAPSKPESGVVPVHHTKVIDITWDAEKEVAALNTPMNRARGFGMFAWFDKNGADPDGDDGYPDSKGDWKFPHHHVTDGEPGDAVVSACRNGLARLDGADIPDADRAGVKAHLQAHIDDFNKNSGGSSAGSAVPGGGDIHTRRESHVDGITSIEELVARREEIAQRMTELDSEAAGRALNDQEQAEFDELTAEAAQIDATTANIETRKQRLAELAGGESAVPAVAIRKPGRGGVHSNVDSRIPENPFDLAAYRGVAKSIDDLASLQVDGALKIAESIKLDGGQGGDRTVAHDHVESVLRADEKGEFARRVILTGNPAYDRAFGKAVMRGKDALTAHEDGLIKAAISESGLGSETPVPITIDPTVLLTSDGATNPLRGAADVRTITGLTYRGLNSDGVTATYEAELTEVAAGAPTFPGQDVNVVRADAYVEFSVEVDADWPSLRADLAMMFNDAKDVAEGTKFFLGSGSGEPQGLITALTASTAPVVVQKTATTAVFAATDPKLASNALPPRWDARAQWFAHKAVWGTLEDLLAALGNNDPFSFVAGGGASPSQRPGQTGNTGMVYRGYPMNYASVMDSATSTSGKNIMVIGDASRGYVIVDRIGLNVELNPIVIGSNRRPIGARGLWAYWRNTGYVRSVKAFQVLQVK